MIRVGVIGLGDISKIHLSLLKNRDDVRVVAVCDINERKRSDIRGASFYDDYNNMLITEELDAVHILLPHYLHWPVTKACLEKGIHVFLEKPMGLDLKEARKLVQEVKNYPELKVNVCLQNRFNETSMMMKSLIDSGVYGNVKGMKGIIAWNRPRQYYEDQPWRGKLKQAGGGVLINQSIHTLDLMQWFAGEVKSIKGQILQLLDYGVEVEDSSNAIIEFKSGAKGIFFATNANQYNSSVEIEVILEKARLQIKDNILSVWNTKGRQELVEDNVAKTEKFYYGDGHKVLIDKFYKSLENDSNQYVSPEDALESMKMIDAIIRSSETGKKIEMES